MLKKSLCKLAVCIETLDKVPHSEAFIVWADNIEVMCESCEANYDKTFGQFHEMHNGIQFQMLDHLDLRL